MAPADDTTDAAQLRRRHEEATALIDAGHVDVATDTLHQLLGDSTRLLGPDDPQTAATRDTLAWLLRDAGHVEAAIDMLEQVCDHYHHRVGALLAGRLNTEQAELLRHATDRLEAAVDALDELRTAHHHPPPADGPTPDLATGTTLTAHAQQHADGDRNDDTIATCEATLADHALTFGPDAAETSKLRVQLADLLDEAGLHDKAATVLEQLVDTYTRVHGPDAPETLGATEQLAWQQNRAGRVDDAVATYRALLATHTRLWGPDDYSTYTVRELLVDMLDDTGQHDEALTANSELIAAYTRVKGATDEQTLYARWHHGTMLVAAGRRDEAIAELRDTLTTWSELADTDPTSHVPVGLRGDLDAWTTDRDDTDPTT